MLNLFTQALRYGYLYKIENKFSKNGGFAFDLSLDFKR